MSRTFRRRTRPRRLNWRRLNWRRLAVVILGLVVVLPAIAAGLATLLVRGSLPRLDGARAVAGFEAPVTIGRDALGVPDIAADNRLDAARALGYLHAQDRYFQMDLQRRNAAGELSALVGAMALDMDRNHRRHRFRSRAAAVLAQLEPHERAILDAYTVGVNAGLRDLRVRPWEYLLLRQRPQPWRAEDSVLTLYSMFLDLSLTDRTELAWGAARDLLPPPLADFLLAPADPWAAPVQSGAPLTMVLPDSSLVDARTWDFGGRTWLSFLETPEPDLADSTGSNNWAVSGRRTGHGRSLLANDMHLGHGLPNIWYRARLSWPEGGDRRAVVGVTLPGTPAVVVGSNGQVAWGFTNSYGDWLDLVVVEADTAAAATYRTPDGWRAFDEHLEVIAVTGARPDTVRIRETIWGPLWHTDTRGRPLALRWTAHDADAVNLRLLGLESVADVEAAVALAGSVGIPPQNFVCADREGRIAWTIAGRIPRRVGWDGRTPVSWADGAHRWDGYLDPAAQPRVIDPAEGLLWTANNRVASGQDLSLIGDGGYGLGARARQIRDGLRALAAPVEADMLALQLDDRAVMLGQWRDLVLAVLERHQADAGLAEGQATFLRIVRDEWGGRAEPSSASYRLMRHVMIVLIDRAYELLTHPVQVAEASLEARELPYRHAVTWTLLTERPPHLLPAGARDWDAVVLAAVQTVVEAAAKDGQRLEDRIWGEVNTVRVEHPFASVVPRLHRRLAAPARPLPGDAHVPRVQGRTSGASQRLVVSPGHEQDGLFHMPGGQSGHPLSPFFLAGHEDWAEGRPSPLLPQQVVHRLVLQPR